MGYRSLFLALALSAWAFCGSTGCRAEGERARGDSRLTLMCWNAQTFFDATDDGREFREFRGAKSGWGQERYVCRLDRLREAILLAGEELGCGIERGPDLVVLQEIESERVLRDLANRMPRRSQYRYIGFVPPAAGCSFGCAVLSRCPIRSVTAHATESSSGRPEGSGLRPLLRLGIDTGLGPITLFAFHWKSKAGDTEAEDEAASRCRAAQEALLAREMSRASEGGSCVIACGDANQTLDESRSLGTFDCAWESWLGLVEAGAVPGPEGSYLHEGAWETIDQIWYAGNIELADFRVLSRTPFVDVRGTPARYSVYSGVGYSDHLPLVAAFARHD
ncbi:MAG TPA: endonuclease/exonuclease/phosphatase family protein [Treponemataceae bacterium]|nr:endonuclease/exonuclease/phosphatase family protein [Treponemataceae bacterium]